MPPKRPPADAMTLHELGIVDIDCGLDPDGLLDGPPADATDALSDLEAAETDDARLADKDLIKAPW